MKKILTILCFSVIGLCKSYSASLDDDSFSIKKSQKKVTIIESGVVETGMGFTANPVVQEKDGINYLATPRFLAFTSGLDVEVQEECNQGGVHTPTTCGAHKEITGEQDGLNYTLFISIGRNLQIHIEGDLSNFDEKNFFLPASFTNLLSKNYEGKRISITCEDRCRVRTFDSIQIDFFKDEFLVTENHEMIKLDESMFDILSTFSSPVCKGSVCKHIFGQIKVINQIIFDQQSGYPVGYSVHLDDYTNLDRIDIFGGDVAKTIGLEFEKMDVNKNENSRGYYEIEYLNCTRASGSTDCWVVIDKK